jgi:acyl-CoA thioesterase-1
MSLFGKSASYASMLLAVAACSQEPPTANVAEERKPAVGAGSTAPQEEGKFVLAFGDSLYAGYGLSADESFPAQLEQALRGAGVPATVHNAGVSGDTSAAGRQRLEFTLGGLPRKPDLAIVGLGGNDMLRGIDPGETEANLRAICGELRKRGIEVILTGMLAAPNLGRDYGERFNGLFRKVAESCGAALYPFFLDGVVTDPSLMLGDRIHPNSKGIDRMVAKVAPLVAQELRG